MLCSNFRCILLHFGRVFGQEIDAKLLFNTKLFQLFLDGRKMCLYRLAITGIIMELGEEALRKALFMLELHDFIPNGDQRSLKVFAARKRFRQHGGGPMRVCWVRCRGAGAGRRFGTWCGGHKGWGTKKRIIFCQEDPARRAIHGLCGRPPLILACMRARCLYIHIGQECAKRVCMAGEGGRGTKALYIENFRGRSPPLRSSARDLLFCGNS